MGRREGTLRRKEQAVFDCHARDCKAASFCKSGTAEELSSDPQVRKVYLGKHFELKRKV